MAYVELTKESFEEVITSNDTVVVDYWADWCGPCKSFGPIFEKVSEDFPEGALRDVVSKAENLNMVEVHKQVAQQQAEQEKQAPSA